WRLPTAHLSTLGEVVPSCLGAFVGVAYDGGKTRKLASMKNASCQSQKLPRVELRFLVTSEQVVWANNHVADATAPLPWGLSISARARPWDHCFPVAMAEDERLRIPRDSPVPRPKAAALNGVVHKERVGREVAIGLARPLNRLQRTPGSLRSPGFLPSHRLDAGFHDRRSFRTPASPPST